MFSNLQHNSFQVSVPPSKLLKLNISHLPHISHYLTSHTISHLTLSHILHYLTSYTYLTCLTSSVALKLSHTFHLTPPPVFLYAASNWYSGTPLKGHPWNEDTPLIRTLHQVPTSYKYVLFAPWNEDTPLIRTHFKGPRVSVLEGSHCITFWCP